MPKQFEFCKIHHSAYFGQLLVLQDRCGEKSSIKVYFKPSNMELVERSLICRAEECDHVFDAFTLTMAEALVAKTVKEMEDRVPMKFEDCAPFPDEIWPDVADEGFGKGH